MNINISTKDFVWSFLGYFLNIGVSVILLPFILKYLDTNEIGLWYTFISLSVLINLIDFGFSSTITRNISYAWGGATKLLKEGTGKINKSKKKNFKLLKSILNASIHIYSIVSFVAFLILFIIFTKFIKEISYEINGSKHIYSWYIFSTGICLNLFYSYWTSLLKGIGAVKESQKAIIFSKIFQLIFTIIGLYFSYGLLSIALGFLLGGLLMRLLSKKYFYKVIRNENLGNYKISFFKIEDKSLYKILFYNAWRLGIVSIGAYMILQLNTLISSYYLGLEVTASYGLTLQLFTILIGVSSTIYITLQPRINEANLNNNKKLITNIISFCILSNWIIYF